MHSSSIISSRLYSLGISTHAQALANYKIYYTVKLLIQAGSQIEAGSPIQAGGFRSLVMRPSSLGGGRILRRTLSVRPSVCLSVPLSLPLVTSFRQPSRMYFSARTEGRISYGHLGRTDSCFILFYGE